MSSITVHVRDRRQITLPVDIVARAGLRTDDTLEVSWVRGAIVMVPTHAEKQAKGSMNRFLGAARGLYGADAAAADAYLNEQRETW